MSNKMYDIQHGTAPRCQHIFDTNLQCQSPALRGRSFCYWHQQNRKYKEKFTVPLLETAHAIQLTLSRITADLYDGKIDTKRATALYYGLSLAMFNVRHISHCVSSDHIIDLPPAMLDGFELPESVQDVVAVDIQDDADLCHPERGRISESKDPDTADTTDAASTISHHEPSAPFVPSRPLRGTDLAPGSSDLAISPDLYRFVKRVLRAGPSHPRFHEVSRIYDRYISAKQAG